MMVAGGEPRETRAGTRRGSGGRRLRVLVVEDDRSLASMLESYLTANGHSARAVHNGADAIETASRWAPDVVLLDIGLPDISGMEVARECRSRCQPVPYLWAFTGSSSEGLENPAVDRVLRKPVEGPLLSRMLEELVTRRSGAR